MPFTEASLKFLRGLKKNNDREWFNQRKPLYEQELKSPMLALIDEINHAFADFAPQFVRPPHKVMLRIFRDTRFSANKLPYKTHLSAWWGAGMSKTSGAGFYFSLSATEISFAAGLFMPTTDQLLAIRRHLVNHHPAYRRLLASSRLRDVFEIENGNPLTRPPKGFSPTTDPAVRFALDLLLQRRWGVSATLPAAEALSPQLATRIASGFRLANPLVTLLNTPLTTAPDPLAASPRKPLF